MRTRVLLVVAVVLTASFATIGGVTAQTGAETSELAKLVRAFRDANVQGDLVTANDPEVLSPFGGPSQLPQDLQDQVTIVESFHTVVQPGSAYSHFNPNNQNIAVSFTNDEGVVDTQVIDPIFPQGWTPPLVQNGLLSDNGLPAPSDFFDIFFDVEIPDLFDDQFADGQPFPVDGAMVVPPAGGVFPDFTQPFEIRAARFAQPLPGGFCEGTILELFTGDAMPGAPRWTPADFAPNDTFGDLSQAHVLRCVDGLIQPIQLLVNNGSNFQPQPSLATGILTPEAFFQILPFNEVMGSEACRQGAFITDAANPFQPDTVAFSTAPNFSDGLAPMIQDTTYVENPWTGANLYPVGLNFGEGSEGGPGFQDNYLMAINPKEEFVDFAEFAAILSQVGTYQLMEGTLVINPDTETYSGMLEGSGEGYMESILFGEDGSIIYTHDTGSPEVYEVTMESGNDADLVAEMLAAYDEREAAAVPETTTTSEPAPTTITSPGDDPGSEGDDEGSGSPLLIIILILLVLAAIAGFFWWMFFAKKPDPCKELYDAWLKAKQACDEAKAKAKKARADADKAKTDREKAEKAKEDHCKAFPPACGPQSSITDVGSGRTLTRDDLHVQRQWAASGWAAYKGKTMSAQELQDHWNSEPSKDFRDKEMEKLKEAKKKTPELDKATAAAKKAETEANEAADAAEKAAKKACDDAAAAKKAYDDCIAKGKAADAASDAAATSAAAAAAGGVAGAVAGAAMAAGQPGGGGCQPQQQAYDTAKKACDDAKAVSDKAAKEAADAEKALSDAEQDVKDLCEEYPPLCEKESWIEESGKPETRITNRDLHARAMWAEQVWVDYQTDQISAQEASERWAQDPPPEFVKDELQKVEDAKPLMKAREQAVKDAKAKVEAAKKAAAEAKAKADAACAKAAQAKKALDACLAATGAK